MRKGVRTMRGESRELGLKILKEVEDNPKQHNQINWVASDQPEVNCCTTLCIASWACYFAGDSFIWVKYGDGGFGATRIAREGYSDGQPIDERAGELLDITEGSDEWNDLFFNTDETAIRALKRLTQL